ncbi:MAG: efflux RND transporter periplasmic adaptor subunit [Sodaliphilus sp.]
MKQNVSILCGIAATCAIALLSTGCKQEQEAQKSQPVKVTVMKASPQIVGAEQEFSGTVEESSGTTMSFPVSGTLQQIRVEAGQRVAKGELVAVLDESTLRRTYDMAATALAQAQDAYNRMKILHDANSLPEIQWVEVESKLKQAQSAEAISKKNLADTRLYAPFSGVVSEKSVEVGYNVMPGQPVAKLVTIDRVKVCVSIPENEVSQIHLGASVQVRVPALNGKVFAGTIEEKGVIANSLSRSYEVKAIVSNPSAELMPGMVCTMAIASGKSTEAIVLPASVVQMSDHNHTFVWVNHNGKARKRQVQTGALTPSGVVIRSGIAAGDEVIVEGQQKVSEGMDITTK